MSNMRHEVYNLNIYCLHVTESNGSQHIECEYERLNWVIIKLDLIKKEWNFMDLILEIKSPRGKSVNN